MTKAIIYCRVSSERQVNEGHGLDSQERRCLDYVNAAGYEVLKICRDEGKSGALFERPAMREVLKCLEENRLDSIDESIVVVFDDLKRFARNTEIHFQLKREIYGRNGRVECPNFRFEDSPAGRFVETVMAATAELERNQNRIQVIQKMKARLISGFWPFFPPPGLINVKDSEYGRVLSSDEPFASIYKEAIEKFANEILLTPEDVQQFILKRYKQNKIVRKLSISGTKRILTQILYAGWLEYKHWDIPLMKAKHKGFISIDAYNKVQERLKQKSRFCVRRDYRVDFALKPFVLCAECGKPFTASWTKGRNEYYANYWCKTFGCPLRYKTVRKDILHPEFEAILTQVKPPEVVMNLAEEVLKERWAIMVSNKEETKQSQQTELSSIEGKIDGYLERIDRCSDEALIEVYEGKIKKLNSSKALLKQQLAKEYYTIKDFETASTKVFNAIKNPLDMWRSEDYNDKRTIIGMYFEDSLRYRAKQGFETASLALPIVLLNEFSTQKDCGVETPILKPGLKW